jgi:hypothetical protein
VDLRSSDSEPMVEAANQRRPLISGAAENMCLTCGYFLSPTHRSLNHPPPLPTLVKPSCSWPGLGATAGTFELTVFELTVFLTVLVPTGLTAGLTEERSSARTETVLALLAAAERSRVGAICVDSTCCLCREMRWVASVLQNV